MGRHLQSLTLIMSPELSTESKEYNKTRLKQLRLELDSAEYDYAPALGCYKGQTEQSLVIDVRIMDRLPMLLRLAFGDLKQESVLLVHGDRTGTLLFNNGSQVELGTLKQVYSTEGLDAYTISNGKIYSF